MDFVDEFLNGYITVIVDKGNYDEVEQVVDIFKSLAGDMRVACTETLSDYLHGDAFGPAHFIDIGAACINGASVEYFELNRLPVIMLTAKQFIDEYAEYCAEQKEDTTFDSLLS